MATDGPQRVTRAACVLGAALGAVLLVACGGGNDDSPSGASGKDVGDTVVFADYGGGTREIRTSVFASPFTDETGARVIFADADLAKVPLFAERGRAEWDLIDLDGWDIYRFAQDGFLRKLPREVKRGDDVPGPVADYATGGYVVSDGIAYSTEASRKPRSWADFFDTENFPGKRGLFVSFPVMILEAALLADGVPCEEVYPLDFDRAFAKLDEIRDDVLFYETAAQGIQFLVQGSVSMSITNSGRVFQAKNQGLPVDFLWNEASPARGFPGIPKDAPHPEAAFALADFMAQPEQQAEFARLTGYGPTTSAALDMLPDEILEAIPGSPEHEKVACERDVTDVARQQDEYFKRFAEWAAGS
jgi:putative spermidine/putrescine transport system substrate-binding protein